MKQLIDLRSDTVTLPTNQMMEAIMHAKLGDDIQGDDPTVKELEKLAASLLGKEDALLAISGTMANQIAVMTMTNRGDEIIVGRDSHMYNLEVAGLAALSQVQARPLQVKEGYYDPGEMEKLIHPGDIQWAKTTLLCIENTYNLNRGHLVSLHNMKQIKDVGAQYNIPIFLDGARLFNASAALNVSPAELCQYTDAVQFCLTKGLGCPLGSILAGNKSFIQEARRVRQRLGGGMRQAGIIAAPAIYALEHLIDRLTEDHKKALSLAKHLQSLREVHVHFPQTNILAITIRREGCSADSLAAYLKKKGILVKKTGETEIRMVTHYDITVTMIEEVIKQFSAAFSE